MQFDKYKLETEWYGAFNGYNHRLVYCVLKDGVTAF